jgi:hypothetical protein
MRVFHTCIRTCSATLSRTAGLRTVGKTEMFASDAVQLSPAYASDALGRERFVTQVSAAELLDEGVPCTHDSGRARADLAVQHLDGDQSRPRSQCGVQRHRRPRPGGALHVADPRRRHPGH